MIDRAVAPLRLSVSNIALVAAVAGVGEELLFRAVLQPVIGLWLANVAFTLAHFVPQRYSDSFGTPRSRLVQGLVGFVVIFVIGWVLGVLFARLGLAAAMIAHFVTDLVVFLTYHRMYRWDQPSGVTPPVT